MQDKILKGAILDERVEVSLLEICHVCDRKEDWVIGLVNEGILTPIGEHNEQWRFSGAGLQKAKAAVRLERDLGINIAGIALAIELIEEIKDLRERLYRLEAE